MRDQEPNEDQTPAETDRLLRALADQDRDDDLPAPDDERLRAYREDRLSEGEARELEKLLARSAAGRRRLLELAGIDRSLPLRRVRKAVLGEAARQRRPKRRLSVSRMGGIAAMAAMAAALLLAVLVLYPRQGSLPKGLAYDVSASGQAEVRAAEEVRGEVRAYPATTLRIFLRPRGASPSGVWFALFRREGEALLRVRQPEDVKLESDRGSASFAGTAARMLGTGEPGVHPLYVVVSAREELPSRVELKPGQEPEAALRSSGRLIYPMKVLLLRDE
jgi:hypothetical protein